MTQRGCTKTKVANNTVLDLTKPQFLSTSDNKHSFVDYLALKLANIPGIEYVKARYDADCLIIDTALSAAAEYLRCVTVVQWKTIRFSSDVCCYPYHCTG